jgi:hypothetical protein
VPPLPKSVKQRIAREFGHQVACEAANRPKGRCARPGRTGPAFVIVTVAHHTHPIALLECIVQQPFKGTPGRKRKLGRMLMFKDVYKG